MMNDLLNNKLPKAVIFDWDNTLVDVWDVITDSINEVRASFGQSLWSIDEAKAQCVLAMRESFPLWYGEAWKKARDIFYSRYHQTHLSHLKVMPGAEALLRFLKERGIPAFIVSNKRGDNLRDEIDHLGWGGFFAGVAGSMDAENDKPERGPVDLVLNGAGLKADDPSVWFVGDTHADVDCARAAGCTPVMVHNFEEAERLGVELNFSDCQMVLEALIKISP